MPKDDRAGGAVNWRANAALAHLVTLGLSLAFWAWTDRGLWFFGDEWDFLADRGLGHSPTSPFGIFYPHNEHWSTLPILLWRALFNIFHLSSYWPYLVPLLLVSLGVMHLSWRLAVREGADPWVATGVAAILGFLGAGAEDLGWAFQIGFVGSVLAGLGALAILARPVRPGKVRLDDGAAAALLLASLMCSAAGLAMLAGAAVLVFSRRRYHQAVRALLGPALIFLIWYKVVGHEGLSSHSDQLTLSSFTNLPGYVWTGISGSLGASFNLASAGGALLVGVIVWCARRVTLFRRPGSLLLPLAASLVVFYVLAALGRDNTTVSPDVSRYVYVAIALMVPLLARLLSPDRPVVGARVAVLALCAVTVLGNVGQAQAWVTPRVATTSSLKVQVLAAARLLAQGKHDIYGPSGQPVIADPNLSAAGARELQRAGDMPAGTLTPVDLVNARTMLSVALGRQQLGTGKFYVAGSAYALRAADGPGCTTFAPKVVSPAMEVRLRTVPGETSAIAQVVTPPTPPGSTWYLGALIAPRRGPEATVANEMEMAPEGQAYLSYNDPQAALVLVWSVGTSLTLCGLANAP